MGLLGIRIFLLEARNFFILYLYQIFLAHNCDSCKRPNK
jgi:hypothetical protein